jgi:hypothetical protein
MKREILGRDKMLSKGPLGIFIEEIIQQNDKKHQ